MEEEVLTPQRNTVSQMDKNSVLQDLYTCVLSRRVSELGRKEVFTGKAKFGIFGDGKELPQIAMARVFQKGDFRSGYYRDQTFMMAAGLMKPETFYAQLYAHASKEAEPMSGGRQMSSHFASALLDEKGNWLPQTEMKNVAADVSPTASQMPRLVGLGFASKLYRHNPALQHMEAFSRKGNEIAFGTIGNASTAEGMFWETLNAAGVLDIPMLVSVWDDDYGISVSNEHQITKSNLSELLEGFRREKGSGFEVYTVKGWDYPALLETYHKAAHRCRSQHIATLIHVTELTQPQGHSTSGSHERYKSKERLNWENEYDCIRQFRYWIEDEGLATAEEIEATVQEAEEEAKAARKRAWKAFQADMKSDHEAGLDLIHKAKEQSSHQQAELEAILKNLKIEQHPIRQDILKAVRKTYWLTAREHLPIRSEMEQWLERVRRQNQERYNTHVYARPERSALRVDGVPAQYSPNPQKVDGRQVLNHYFKTLLGRDPRVIAFGEDVGQIGDVNKAFDELQAQFGAQRVMDTGIREATIIGQGIGLAMRGFRPIAEIQYLDYILYALQLMSDDLACLHYRSAGQQAAPLIVRTRGHRLEGIWHAGSPMGTLISSLRGMHICVPRNMTQAAGFYNTLMQGDEPGLVIESLNAYRLKEELPENLEAFSVPLGQPEILREGKDLTIVTYGSMCRIVLQAAEELRNLGIDAEVIDVQTLLPFDRHGWISESLKKTNKLLIADEDMPGAATGFMMREILEEQSAWKYLDAEPATLPSRPHRPPYASDGDYFSKPNVEDIVEKAYAIMSEYHPRRYPEMYRFKTDYQAW